MNLTDTNLTALLGSRICHDLISPLGAIGNGVELLQMSGMADSPELSLITESVENANARIRLFRVAFGAADVGQSISRTEILGVLTSIAEARKIEIAWEPANEMPRGHARLIFLLLLCCETVLPYGGRISVAATDHQIVVIATAERMRHAPEFWAYLDRTDLELPQASEIHFPLAREAAEGLGRRITVALGETRIAINA